MFKYLPVAVAEAHTILCALRHYRDTKQTIGSQRSPHLDEIATDLGSVKALTTTQCKELEARLNLTVQSPVKQYAYVADKSGRPATGFFPTRAEACGNFLAHSSFMDTGCEAAQREGFRFAFAHLLLEQQTSEVFNKALQRHDEVSTTG